MHGRDAAVLVITAVAGTGARNRQIEVAVAVLVAKAHGGGAHRSGALPNREERAADVGIDTRACVGTRHGQVQILVVVPIAPVEAHSVLVEA